MELSGRDLKKLLTSAVKALERNAEATEEMLKIANSEQLVTQEPGPPVCPHCGKVDPEITDVSESGGSGFLSGFVIVGETHCCNKTLYAVPFVYDTFTSAEMAQAAIMQTRRAE